VRRPTSETTRRANEFIRAHLDEARRVGRALSRELSDPDAFERTLTSGLQRLADPEYAAVQPRVAPGVGSVAGVRGPLLGALLDELRAPLRAASPAIAIYLAERLTRSGVLETRLIALAALSRSLPDDPERTWQLIRRLARRATDWLSVDSLADLVARGLLLEPYRWAELEQLVYSPHRWERRLVGSTLATLPFRVPRAARGRLASTPALSILGSLVGDAEPGVQKALSWALRSWTRVDPGGVAAFLEREADRARSGADGHRAWVIRDALSAQPAESAAAIRARLAGIRRRPDMPSTSRASEVAGPFLAALPDAYELAEAPLPVSSGARSGSTL
jgi:3-methyladenine DNA glycosylase AlkD